jgi:nucleotide-binding universal stress UspA family protein
MQELAAPVRRILLPASNPRQAQVAFAVGYGLGRSLGAEAMEVVTVFPVDVADGEVQERMEEMMAAVQEASGLEMESWQDEASLDGMAVTFRDDYSNVPLARIRDLSQGFDLMVVGAGPGTVSGRDVLGRVTWTLATQAHCPVVAVKRRTGGLHFQVQSFFDFFRDEPGELEGEAGGIHAT